MAVVNRVMVGESLVNDADPAGNMAEIAHIDLLMGPRGSAVETAFCNGMVNNKDGFTCLLAVVAPNLACKPNTMMFNKVTIKGLHKQYKCLDQLKQLLLKQLQTVLKTALSQLTKQTTYSYVLVYLFTGKLRATKLSMRITTKQ